MTESRHNQDHCRTTTKLVLEYLRITASILDGWRYTEGPAHIYSQTLLLSLLSFTWKSSYSIPTNAKNSLYQHTILKIAERWQQDNSGSNACWDGPLANDDPCGPPLTLLHKLFNCPKGCFVQGLYQPTTAKLEESIRATMRL